MAEVFANPLVDLAEYTDMKQDLVNHRFDLCGFHQALNISDLEI